LLELLAKIRQVLAEFLQMLACSRLDCQESLGVAENEHISFFHLKCTLLAGQILSVLMLAKLNAVLTCSQMLRKTIAAAVSMQSGPV